MIVLNPTNTTHEFKFIPRFVPSEDLSITIYDENSPNQISYTISNTYIYLDGNITIVFDFDFVESQKFQIKIIENNEIVYRDKLFITAQTTQDFKATKDLYYYE
jgi:hypothetical protein